MATNYPGGIDSLTNPSAGDALTSPSHSAQHANANDAIEAIETELGTNPSGSESTVAARLTAIEAGTNLGANSVGATALADNAVDTNAIQAKAVTAAKIADDTITATQIAANAVGTSELADSAVDTAAIQDGAVTAAKLAVQPGNLLTANQASCTDASGDTTGMASLGGSTIARSTAWAAQGTGSLLVTLTGTGTYVAITAGRETSGIPVTPGETISATFTAKAGTAVGRAVDLIVDFWNSAGAYVSSAVTSWSMTTTPNTLQLTATVPAGVAYMGLTAGAYTATTGETFYIDRAGLWRGSGGTWALPGTPILGLTDAPLGNLLTLNQASPSLTGGYTLDAATEGAAGVYTATSTGSGGAYTTVRNINAGDVVTVVATLAPVGRAARVLISWRNSSGAQISFVMGNSVSAGSTGESRITETAPAGTVSAIVYASYWSATGSAGDSVTVSKAGVWKGAAGVYTAPGVPVVGQSRIAVNGAVDLSGTGSPEGVVTAAPGSTWLQTDATTDVKGWIRWVKATGTGNTGWVAGAESDTGNRNVGSLLVNGWTPGGGLINLSRLGNLVTMHGVLEAAAATATTALTLPSGFRPRNSEAYFPVQFGSSPGTSRVMEIGTSGVVKVYSYGAGAHYVGLTFRTNEAWPSSLPGSAA